jgi:hypothetical protein
MELCEIVVVAADACVGVGVVDVAGVADIFPLEIDELVALIRPARPKTIWPSLMMNGSSLLAQVAVAPLATIELQQYKAALSKNERLIIVQPLSLKLGADPIYQQVQAEEDF